jgi:hypothetical protein
MEFWDVFLALLLDMLYRDEQCQADLKQSSTSSSPQRGFCVFQEWDDSGSIPILETLLKVAQVIVHKSQRLSQEDNEGISSEGQSEGKNEKSECL